MALDKLFKDVRRCMQGVGDGVSFGEVGQSFHGPHLDPPFLDRNVKT